MPVGGGVNGTPLAVAKDLSGLDSEDATWVITWSPFDLIFSPCLLV